MTDNRPKPSSYCGDTEEISNKTPMKIEPAIHLRGITKKYGNVAVVDDLTLTIPPGTIFGFLGPNGAGKSTTIKVMTGIEAPDEGDALIMGCSVRAESLAVKRMIGVVPDGLALFEYLSVWEHFNMVREVYDLSAAVFDLRSTQLLKLLDLSPYVHQLARKCSYGTRKKVALAMALLPSPKVLVLDEPFEGLDPVMNVTVKRALQRAARGGATIFITTHVLDAVEDLIEQYGILHKGRLVAQGDTRSLKGEGMALQMAYLNEFSLPTEAELEWLG